MVLSDSSWVLRSCRSRSAQTAAPVAHRHNPAALILIDATGAVFVMTWLLHGYQWFWIRGTLQLRALDAAFWGILGALVVLNLQSR